MAEIYKAISRTELERMIEALPFGILVVRGGQEAVYCNELLKKMFPLAGEPAEQLLEMDFLKDSLLGVNARVELCNRECIVRKELIKGEEEDLQLYLFSFSNETNELVPVDDNQLLLLRDIVEFAYDGLVMVDAHGYVQMLTKAYADFLGLDQEAAVGRHVTEVIENTRLHIVAETGRQETAELQKINNRYIIATRTPVMKDGKIAGVIGKVLYQNAAEFTSLYKRVKTLEKEVKKYKGDFRERNKASYTFDQLIGSSSDFLLTKEQAARAAAGSSNVLLLGESGTGKELFAHSIHMASSRSLGVFVKVNCAAIPAELLESELFGYEEGSFTGARRGGKVGKFEAADGGTIFLDEVGELPLHMQVKLLRVLQEKEIERVGSTSSIRVDIRVIAATNRNLEAMVQRGEFRLDLYYRLKVMEIRIPSLRERAEDIELLAQHFAGKYQRLLDKPAAGISNQAMRQLLLYQWPGNIRELENVIERALNIIEPGEEIQPRHLPAELTGIKDMRPVRTLTEILEETERQAIADSLRLAAGNKSEAAKRLGISRTTLYEKLDKLGLK